MIYTIQLNATGTHQLEITEDNLNTIRKYALFRHLVDSNGYVSEDVLEKLRLNIRSIIASSTDCKDLLDLCIDVIYHDKMKAYGLKALIEVFQKWNAENPEETPEEQGNAEA